MIKVIQLAILFLVSSTDIYADFYCGSSIIDVGTNYNKVLAACGQPSSTEKVQPVYTPVNRQLTNEHEKIAIYNFGSSTFMQQLTIDQNNKVIGIEQLGYGK